MLVLQKCRRGQVARSRCRKLRDEKNKREEEERRKKEEEEKKNKEDGVQVKGGDAVNEEDEEEGSTQVSSGTYRTFLLYSQTVKCITQTFSLCFSAGLCRGAEPSDGGDPEAGERD